MKTELQKSLARVALSISIVTVWEKDPDSRFSELARPGCAFENESPNDWTAWQSEVCATAIIGGEEITGEDYLGGTWEKYGVNPAVSNPEISGYENQMTDAALCKLARQLPGETPLHREIMGAIAILKEESERSYAAQRAAKG